jgi:hypothetical protein
MKTGHLGDTSSVVEAVWVPKKGRQSGSKTGLETSKNRVFKVWRDVAPIKATKTGFECMQACTCEDLMLICNSLKSMRLGHNGFQRPI